jgi:hypothetical protein
MLSSLPGTSDERRLLPLATGDRQLAGLHYSLECVLNPVDASELLLDSTVNLLNI